MRPVVPAVAFRSTQRHPRRRTVNRVTRLRAWFGDHAGATDIAAALLLVGLAQAEVWTMDDPGPPRPVLAGVALVMTAPLAWRRRRPLASAMLIAAALAVATFAWDTPDKAVFPTIAIVLAVYTAAAHCDVQGAIAGFA